MYLNKINLFLVISICLIFFFLTYNDVKSIEVKVIDGDTIHLNGAKIRFTGIDTPELRTSDKLEKVFGLAAKNRLKELIPEGSIQILKTEVDKDGEDAKGKFGRILGDFIVEGYRITEILVDEGHAVEYHGQSKEDIQDEHNKNRQRLVADGKVIIEED